MSTAVDVNVVNETTTAATAAVTVAAVDCDARETEFMEERFWLVAVLGSCLSVVSVAENAFLVGVFLSSKQHRHSHSLYLLLLALSDLFISGTYILLMSVRVLFNFASSVYLKRIWMAYVVPTLTMSHIAITTSTFLIVCVTVERYCVTMSHGCVACLQRNRLTIALLAVAIGIISKGTFLFEITPEYIPACANTLGEFKLVVTKLVQDNQHYKLWRFWFRNIVTILFPFFTLMLLNAFIVNELRKHGPDDSPSSRSSAVVDRSYTQKQRKARIRAATRTLVFVVCTYLLANALNVVITIWEHTNALSLFTRFLNFYIISVDAVSLLTVFACALRLPIYASCNAVLRREMLRFAKKLACLSKSKTKEVALDSSIAVTAEPLLQ